MLGIALWIVALGLMLHFVDRPRRHLIATFSVVCVLLVLTRPMLFIPAAAALALFLFGLVNRDKSNTIAGATFFGIAVMIELVDLYYIRLSNGAGISSAITVVYNNDLHRGTIPAGQSMSSWYRRTIIGMLNTELKRSIKTFLPLLAAVSAVVNFDRPQSWIFVGAAATGLLSIVLDPNPYDLTRVVEAPLYVVMLASIAVGCERFLVTRASSAPPPPHLQHSQLRILQ
jgi:hypothetical protein